MSDTVPAATPRVQPEIGATTGPAARSLVKLLRPHHWLNNAFVFAPLVFAGLLTDRMAVTQAVTATLLFSLTASAVYLVNDLIDMERDRAHPLKRVTRPLAAGEVSAPQAIALLSALLAALAVGLTFVPVVVPGITAYLAVNLAYSVKLKHVPVVELFCVGSGFVLRVWVGAVAIGVPLSTWMLITTLCLAIYLASVKRRQELAQNGSLGRSVLDAYSQPLLERYGQVAAIGTIVFYGLYVTEVRPELAISIPLVLFGVFRYAFIVETRGKGESPADALWSDLPLALTVLAWATLCVFVIYRG